MLIVTGGYLSGKEHNVFFSVDYIIKGTVESHTENQLEFNLGNEKYLPREAPLKFIPKSSMSDTVDLKCGTCEKNFKSRQGLQTHMDWHKGTLNHKCPECPKTFVTRHKTNRHMVARHKRKLGVEESTRHINCPNCVMKFQSHNKLSKHMAAIHKMDMKQGAPEEFLNFGGISKGEPKLESFTFIDTQFDSHNDPAQDDSRNKKFPTIPKKQKTIALHPTYKDMISNAIRELKNTNGASRQALLR